MLARREQIVVAVVQLLKQGCPSVVVERNRRSVVDIGEAPHLNVLDGGHTTEFDTLDTIYTMRIDIDATVAAATDDAIGPALNGLYVSTLSALLADPSLDGLCTDLREEALDVRVAPDVESSKPLADFTLGLVVEFRTPDGDPTG